MIPLFLSSLFGFILLGMPIAFALFLTALVLAWFTRQRGQVSTFNKPSSLILLRILPNSLCPLIVSLNLLFN
jgi:hypothetical protein